MTTPNLYRPDGHYEYEVIDMLDNPRPTRSATQPWHRSRNEVWQFARDLHKASMFGISDDECDPADLMLDYFQSPWAWNDEHTWWEAHDRTDDPVVWDGYST